MVSWEWKEDGKVLVDGKEYRVLDPKPAEVGEYAARLDLESRVFKTLLQAKTLFEIGQADYEDAYAKLKGLLAAFDQAEAGLHEVSQEFSAFFDPPGITEHFSKDQNGGGSRFINEALRRFLMKKV